MKKGSMSTQELVGVKNFSRNGVQTNGHGEMFKGSYNRKNDDFICTDQFGELLRPNYVTQHYRLLLEKNGLRHIRFHDLRHTFASILLSNRT